MIAGYNAAARIAPCKLGIDHLWVLGISIALIYLFANLIGFGLGPFEVTPANSTVEE